jgi:hypothetical protein
LTNQYEQLRSDALSLVESTRRKGTAGMKLFLQSGMAAWLHTASEYLGEPRTAVASRRQDSLVPYPFDLRTEAISILAGMILNRSGEEVAL